MYHKINLFKFKKLIPVAILFLVANQASAEGLNAKYPVFSQVNETITGKIVNPDGSAVEGATVTILETGTTAITDALGNFTISATIGQTISVSYNGNEQLVKIAGTTVSVTLQSKDTTIEEVMIVGYGSQKKTDLTGAISQLKAEQFKEGMNISVDNLMQGKIAGVRIVQSSGEPGAGVNVSIRGIGSVRSGSTPLFVVDGIPLSNDAVSAGSPNVGLGNTQAKNPLNFLNTSE